MLRFDLQDLVKPGSYVVLLGLERREFMALLNGRMKGLNGLRPRSVLYRRPAAARAPEELSDLISRSFFEAEFQVVAESLHRLCDDATLWVNAPSANAYARNKLWQLACAAEAGLAVPPTLVTNDPDIAYAFYLDVERRAIVKPLSPAPASSEGGWALFTRLLPESLSAIDFSNVRYGSSILQRFVDKTCDVRVAVVGEVLLACQILSQGVEQSRVDWRTVARGLPHIPTEVPPHVAAGLRRLRSRLGLATMHADFAVDQGGRWWFLETNPNGQWLWLELEVGIPVSMALANLLIDANTD